uniref:CCHC-type domain-containing protein n=1 Tax=Ananas comosus var. bracteatus TaxID=296719 RepID=A0A6V7QIN4_ANACO|nr:unnamed protein product [Ananas comosus var. bracteatus]
MTGKKIGDEASHIQWRKVTGSRGTQDPSTSLAPLSHTAYNKEIGVIEAGAASNKKVTWADEEGIALTQAAVVHLEDPSPITRATNTSTNIFRRSSDTGYGTSSINKTYKEALLTPGATPSRDLQRPQRVYSFPSFKSLHKSFFKGKCFRCLGLIHWASSCRKPRRCARCYKTGHVAKSCMDRLPMAVYREMRARPSYLSAFVPQTEDFFTRQNRCRNAILVDVLPPRILGHFPQETLANRLASRFGGFPSDFHVAKFSQRDYVIFLPEWVTAAQLVRREILSLDNLRLQCYPWNPYFGLRRASLTYNVWIRLVSLPYECWSSRTVAALVGGFGRFIRADDFSSRMVDLTGYRCLISVNFLSDIPENLEITVGDYSLSHNPRDRRREALIPNSSLRCKFSPSSGDSIRIGEVESVRKGPTIVGRSGATFRNLNLPEAGVAPFGYAMKAQRIFYCKRSTSIPEIGATSSSPGWGRTSSGPT